MKVTVEPRDVPEPRTPEPPWWAEPHPFHQTDQKMVSRHRVAWGGTDGVVYAEGGERVVAEHSEPFSSYEFKLWDVWDTDTGVEFTTAAGGWSFDVETKRCHSFFGRTRGSETVHSARRVFDSRGEGAVAVVDKAIRLMRPTPLAPIEVCSVELPSDEMQLALAFNRKVVVAYGMKGALLFAVRANGLELLAEKGAFSLFSYVGEVETDGGTEVQVADNDGKVFAFVGIEAALAAVPTEDGALSLTEPHGYPVRDERAAVSPPPSTALPPIRRGEWVYAHDSDVDTDLHVLPPGGEWKVVQLGPDARRAVVSDRGEVFATDPSRKRVLEWKEGEWHTVHELSGKRLVFRLFAVDQVLWVWEENPDSILRIAKGKMTHTCPIMRGRDAVAIAGYAGSESALVVVDNENAAAAYVVPSSGRKKKLDQPIALPEGYSGAFEHRGSLFLTRQWHDDGVVWELRGLESGSE